MIPSSLASPDLAPVFEAVRSRLERLGAGKRGRMRLPEGTSIRARFVLGALVDARVRSTVDLAVLERKLAELGVGGELAAALSTLGYPVSNESQERRELRRQTRDARQAARDEVAGWSEAWATEWISGAVQAGVLSGLSADEAVSLVRDVRAVVDRIEAGSESTDRQSRVDLAAGLLGDAHALDWGTRTSAALTRALALRYGGRREEAWERAGVNLDRVSAPVLTWGLAPSKSSSLATVLHHAADLGIPVHLSQLALRQHPVVVDAGADILVTENPRMAEAACERRTPYSVVALNGDPSGAARLLVEQLLSCGAELRYHGDFDAAGLRICGRMHRLGLKPWRMGSRPYLEAVENAEAEGARLPVDIHRSPPTAWDFALQSTFDRHRRIVHEERLIAQLLK